MVFSDLNSTKFLGKSIVYLEIIYTFATPYRENTFITILHSPLAQLVTRLNDFSRAGSG